MASACSQPERAAQCSNGAGWTEAALCLRAPRIWHSLLPLDHCQLLVEEVAASQMEPPEGRTDGWKPHSKTSPGSPPEWVPPGSAPGSAPGSPPPLLPLSLPRARRRHQGARRLLRVSRRANKGAPPVLESHGIVMVDVLLDSFTSHDFGRQHILLSISTIGPATLYPKGPTQRHA